VAFCIAKEQTPTVHSRQLFSNRRDRPRFAGIETVEYDSTSKPWPLRVGESSCQYEREIKALGTKPPEEILQLQRRNKAIGNMQCLSELSPKHHSSYQPRGIHATLSYSALGQTLFQAMHELTRIILSSTDRGARKVI
jgi:hypothetical protein